MPVTCAAALQIDQRVGQHQVVLGDVIVVAAHVVAELRLALAEVIGALRPRRRR